MGQSLSSQVGLAACCWQTSAQHRRLRPPSLQQPAGDDPEAWRQKAHEHAERRGQLLQASRRHTSRGGEQRCGCCSVLTACLKADLREPQEARLCRRTSCPFKGRKRAGSWKRPTGEQARLPSRPTTAGQAVDFVDLHGLYVKEAEKV